MKPMTITIQDEKGAAIWSFTGGNNTSGLTSMAYLTDGTQQRIIDALLLAVAEARGQLRSPFQITNVVPYVRPAPGEVNNGIPVT
jgi:hypothetical protein